MLKQKRQVKLKEGKREKKEIGIGKRKKGSNTTEVECSAWRKRKQSRSVGQQLP